MFKYLWLLCVSCISCDLSGCKELTAPHLHLISIFWNYQVNDYAFSYLRIFFSCLLMEYCHLLLIEILYLLCILSRHWSAFRLTVENLKLKGACYITEIQLLSHFDESSTLFMRSFSILFNLDGHLEVTRIFIVIVIVLCASYLSMGAVPGSGSWIGKFIQWSYCSSRCCNIWRTLCTCKFWPDGAEGVSSSPSSQLLPVNLFFSGC